MYVNFFRIEVVDKNIDCCKQTYLCGYFSYFIQNIVNLTMMAPTEQNGLTEVVSYTLVIDLNE